MNDIKFLDELQSRLTEALGERITIVKVLGEDFCPRYMVRMSGYGTGVEITAEMMTDLNSWYLEEEHQDQLLNDIVRMIAEYFEPVSPRW